MTESEKKAIDSCKEQVAIDAGYAHKDGRDWHRATFSISRERLDELYDRAMQLYGEQCRPKWIPVTEQLPEKELNLRTSRNVLVIAPVLPGGVVVSFYNYHRNIWSYHFDSITVTHWMDIPELTAQA